MVLSPVVLDGKTLLAGVTAAAAAGWGAPDPEEDLGHLVNVRRAAKRVVEARREWASDPVHRDGAAFAAALDALAQVFAENERERSSASTNGGST